MRRSSHYLLVFFILLLSGVLGFTLSLYLHKNPVQDHSLDNTQMIQAVNTHTPVAFVKQLKGDPDAGRKIYREYCASCHAAEPIIDLNAPALGDKKAWKKRRQQGMAALMKTTISGKGTMPTRGGCFECSDEQLQMTVQYMLQQSAP